MRTLQINPETTMFSSAVPIPTIGVLPVNVYLINGAEPTLIDTGITPEEEEFEAALRAVIDPAALRWIVLTHARPRPHRIPDAIARRCARRPGRSPASSPSA